MSRSTKTLEMISVSPDLVDYSHRYYLRIYVIGDMETNQGVKRVAAYTDITLHP